MASNIVATTKKTANVILAKIPVECWSDPEYLFLDICSKNGMVLASAYEKLDEGLAEIIPDATERRNHILGRQLAAMCPTKEAQEATIKAVFGEEFKSRAFFEHSFHHWDSKDTCFECGMHKKSYNGRSDIDAYCGLHRSVNQSRWLRQVYAGRKAAIVTDPIFNLPLPLRKDNKTYNLYPKYAETAVAMKPNYVAMDAPAKWMVAKDAASVKFRNWLANSCRISELEWFESADALYDGSSQLKGGACVFLWNKNWNSRECQFNGTDCNGVKIGGYRRISFGSNYVYGKQEEMELAAIVNGKILKDKERTVDSLYNAPMTFGLPTNFAALASKPFNGAVKVYARSGQIGWVEKSKISDKGLMKSYKVAIQTKYGCGIAKNDKFTAIVCEPGSCTTASWVTFGPFIKEEAEAFCKNLNTSKYAKMCIALAKRTPDATRKVYTLLPVKGLTNADWNDEAFKDWMGIPEHLHKYVMTAY